MTGENDPYNALSIWYFEANRDPARYLKLFEGVPPKVPGMSWSPNTGWLYVPVEHITNMTYCTGAANIIPMNPHPEASE